MTSSKGAMQSTLQNQITLTKNKKSLWIENSGSTQGLSRIRCSGNIKKTPGFSLSSSSFFFIPFVFSIHFSLINFPLCRLFSQNSSYSDPQKLLFMFCYLDMVWNVTPKSSSVRNLVHSVAVLVGSGMFKRRDVVQFPLVQLSPCLQKECGTLISLWFPVWYCDPLLPQVPISATHHPVILQREAGFLSACLDFKSLELCAI